MDNMKELLLLIGEMNGKLDTIVDDGKEQKTINSKFDDRLRKVETKGAVTGAIAGGVMSVAIAFIVAKAKLFGS